MTKQASNRRKRLARFLTADPWRLAGGSAMSNPLGLPAGRAGTPSRAAVAPA
jgi:hypothetical protein